MRRKNFLRDRDCVKMIVLRNGFVEYLRDEEGLLSEPGGIFRHTSMIPIRRKGRKHPSMKRVNYRVIPGRELPF